MLLHAGPGLLQGACAIHGALLAGVPMVIASSESITAHYLEGGVVPTLPELTRRAGENPVPAARLQRRRAAQLARRVEETAAIAAEERAASAASASGIDPVLVAATLREVVGADDPIVVDETITHSGWSGATCCARPRTPTSTCRAGSVRGSRWRSASSSRHPSGRSCSPSATARSSTTRSSRRSTPPGPAVAPAHRHLQQPPVELTVDVVYHGDVGLGGPWAAHARPGDEVRFVGPGGAYAPDPQARWHLLAGDESALPAIAVALERLPQGARGHAFIEVSSPEDELALPTASDVSVTWLHRGDSRVGDALVGPSTKQTSALARSRPSSTAKPGSSGSSGSAW